MIFTQVQLKKLNCDFISKQDQLWITSLKTNSLEPEDRHVGLNSPPSVWGKPSRWFSGVYGWE